VHRRDLRQDRDGQVADRPIYVSIGVTCAGERDILGLWAGEGAKFWLSVLTEIKNRGTTDVCIVVGDGLKGLPDAINTVWDRAVIQTCVIHLLRNTFRYASRKYWDQIAKDTRPVYTATTRLRPRNASLSSPSAGAADHPAVGERLERRAVSGLRRGDPPRHLFDGRGAITECPLPAGDSGPRTLHDRTGRDEVPLPGDSIQPAAARHDGPLGKYLRSRGRW
jgi:Transposase, Mutator family